MATGKIPADFTHTGISEFPMPVQFRKFELQYFPTYLLIKHWKL